VERRRQLFAGGLSILSQVQVDLSCAVFSERIRPTKELLPGTVFSIKPYIRLGTALVGVEPYVRPGTSLVARQVGEIKRGTLKLFPRKVWTSF
jgi:hypothetical protein